MVMHFRVIQEIPLGGGEVRGGGAQETFAVDASNLDMPRVKRSVLLGAALADHPLEDDAIRLYLRRELRVALHSVCLPRQLR